MTVRRYSWIRGDFLSTHPEQSANSGLDWLVAAALRQARSSADARKRSRPSFHATTFARATSRSTTAITLCSSYQCISAAPRSIDHATGPQPRMQGSPSHMQHHIRRDPPSNHPAEQRGALSDEASACLCWGAASAFPPLGTRTSTQRISPPEHAPSAPSTRHARHLTHHPGRATRRRRARCVVPLRDEARDLADAFPGVPLHALQQPRTEVNGADIDVTSRSGSEKKSAILKC